MRGEVIAPQDAEYEEARKVYNGMIDKRPAAVVRCTGTADVAAAIGAAREDGLDLSVRGGGHSAPASAPTTAGSSSTSARCRMSPSTPTPRRRGRAAAARGPCSTTPPTPTAWRRRAASSAPPGIAGLTLGGGIGYLSRKYGLSCDNLLSAEVVTADGQVLTASEKENDDLFWALRGGGGNFGVVTTFEYRLHPVAEIYGGPIAYPVDRADDVLRFYREYIAEAPEELGGFVGFHLAPPLPFLPEEWHFKNVVPRRAVLDRSHGRRREDDQALPRRRRARRVARRPHAVPGAQHRLRPAAPAWPAALLEGELRREISDGAIAVHADYGAKVPSIQSAVHLYPIDGAVQRVGPDETAFAYRDVNFSPVIAGMWEDPADNDKNIAWVRGYYEALEPYSAEGGYINFMDGDDQGRIKANYRGNYDRLAAVKGTYDPGNLFHMNQNIAPRPNPGAGAPALPPL